MPPGSNNPFGIKALRDEPFVLAMTREFEGGAWRRREARFRKFASFDEAFAHHARLLATAPVYRPAMRNKDDPVAFARALTGVYATDPDYGTKLVQLIEQLDLRLYDVAGAALAPDSAPGVIFPPPISMPLGRLALQLGARGENVTALQLALKQAGYGVGAVDGLFGTLTRAALLAFQADNGLPATGAADGATMARLNDAPQRPLDRDRLMATEEELRLKGSETMIEARRTRMLGLVTTILGALGIGNSVVVNTVGAAPVPATAQPVEDFLARVTTTLAGQPEPDQLQALARSAGDILAGLRAGASPELSRLATQVLDALPADAAARFPEVETLLRAAATTPAAQSVPRTVFDLLPGMVAPGHNLEAIVGGVASLASSLVPGLGGSIGALAIGLLARHFANRVHRLPAPGPPRRHQRQPVTPNATPRGAAPRGGSVWWSPRRSGGRASGCPSPSSHCEAKRVAVATPRAAPAARATPAARRSGRRSPRARAPTTAPPSGPKPTSTQGTPAARAASRSVMVSPTSTARLGVPPTRAMVSSRWRGSGFFTGRLSAPSSAAKRAAEPEFRRSAAAPAVPACWCRSPSVQPSAASRSSAASAPS